jgi:hypothetical protein
MSILELPSGDHGGGGGDENTLILMLMFVARWDEERVSGGGLSVEGLPRAASETRS